MTATRLGVRALVCASRRARAADQPGHAPCGHPAQSPLWAEFFRHLRYVVIDEAHTYRGVFGSQVACVLRRLRRGLRHLPVCRRRTPLRARRCCARPACAVRAAPLEQRTAEESPQASRDGARSSSPPRPRSQTRPSTSHPPADRPACLELVTDDGSPRSRAPSRCGTHPSWTRRRPPAAAQTTGAGSSSAWYPAGCAPSPSPVRVIAGAAPALPRDSTWSKARPELVQRMAWRTAGWPRTAGASA